MIALPSLWLCADLGELEPTELVRRVEMVLQTGPAAVWLRSPSGTSAHTLIAVASTLRSRLRAGSVLLIGDRVDIALAVGAHGVHLTGSSLPAAGARAFASAAGHPGLVISQAVHDAEGVAMAAPSVDVLVLSPFGEVADKRPPLGAHAWSTLRRHAPDVFAVALGGITSPIVVSEAMAAGANAVAVRRALTASVDPASACEALRPRT